MIFYSRGTTGGFGEKDIENETFIPLTKLRTEQPKYSTPGWFDTIFFIHFSYIRLFHLSYLRI